MSGKVFFWLLATVFLITARSPEAQQAKRVPRIGVLVAVSPAVVAARIDALRQGRRELGYIDGQNILIEPRYGEGKLAPPGKRLLRFPLS